MVIHQNGTSASAGICFRDICVCVWDAITASLAWLTAWWGLVIKASAAPQLQLGLTLSPMQDLPASRAQKRDGRAVVRIHQRYGDNSIKRSIIAMPTVDCFSVEVCQQMHLRVRGVVKRMDEWWTSAKGPAGGSLNPVGRHFGQIEAAIIE